MVFVLFILCTTSFHGISGMNSTTSHCRKGTYYNIDTKECSLCPQGQYQNTTGQLNCTQCPNDKITLFTGSDSECKCIDPRNILDPQYNKCVDVCFGLPDGNYQSCDSCSVYVSCSGNNILDDRPCPEYLYWDDYCKQCVEFSTTCYYTSA